MADCCQDGIACNPNDLRQALSVHTRKITDSCRDKDCIEDLRVYLTQGSQSILDSCASAKVRCADLLYTYIDVEPVAFDRNHYCIDVTFFYRILADATVGTNRPVSLYGLAVFSKRAVLCGEESRAHIFTSNTRIGELDGLTLRSANLPTAIVEVADTNSQNTITNPYPRGSCLHEFRRHTNITGSIIQKRLTNRLLRGTINYRIYTNIVVKPKTTGPI